MDRFTELCMKWHTPKVVIEGNDLSHNYAPTYNRLFEGREIKRVLEIGCGYRGLFHQDYVSGGSLFMWAELFPEASDIYGVDIRKDALVNEGRIKSWCCDQSNDEMLHGLYLILEMRTKRGFAFQRAPGIDLIVDDGSHVWADQILTARHLMPLLSPNGVYVIEDVLPRDNYDDFPFHNLVIKCSEGRSEDDRLIVMEAHN